MSYNVLRLIKIALLSLLAMLLLVLVVVYIMPARASSAAQEVPADFFLCTPYEVGTFTNRVHVRCVPAAPNNISYFAYCSTGSDSMNANRFLSVFTTARVTGKNVGIYYTPSDTSGTACGCAASDCRVLWGAEVKP